MAAPTILAIAATAAAPSTFRTITINTTNISVTTARRSRGAATGHHLVRTRPTSTGMRRVTACQVSCPVIFNAVSFLNIRSSETLNGSVYLRRQVLAFFRNKTSPVCLLGVIQCTAFSPIAFLFVKREYLRRSADQGSRIWMQL